ncbi:Rha family transcriptional regulator [Staphylococcus hyicus]|uniref:Rha family transcriptional regulator n=1 Tax=Staphylococcus hyicus TaxID=1284 RepID=UPI002739DD2D|nr:Rha family transcriptional regulator [Staphylococcus hyicus]MDP4459847.1 Rha family transcriptional regulator [Staphylococcus hyicus]
MQALQVIEQNNEFYVDSREVAEMVGKRHDNLVRDIKGYIKILEDSSKLSSHNFFEESTYINSQNKIQPCYLLTKKGCDMVANKMTGSKGVLFTATYVDAFHEMQEHIKKQYQINAPTTQLEAIKMFVQIQEEQQAFNKRIEKDVNSIRHIVGIETKNWRNDTNNILSAIAKHLGGGNMHQKVRAEAYKALEDKGRCNLKIRMQNRKGKMLANGATKTQIKNLSKLDVITDEPRLIEIYISVIKNMAIKYGVDISQFEI